LRSRRQAFDLPPCSHSIELAQGRGRIYDHHAIIARTLLQRLRQLFVILSEQPLVLRSQLRHAMRPRRPAYRPSRPVIDWFCFFGTSSTSF
jgi:hypothetical protein